jgi:hypothetical protein
MFLTEKTPYFLTILFLALGWTITQVSTDLAKSPIIEYKSCKKNHTNETEHIFTITNISSEKLFTNLKFTLRPVDKTDAKCLGEPKMIIPPPTELKGTCQDLGAIQPECVEGKYGVYILPQFQPGASIQLVMKTDKNTDINIYVWCNEAVRLAKLSFKTLIVKERLKIMMWLIAIWAILIIIYSSIIHYKKIKPQPAEGEE